MSTSIVVDASVALKWVVTEDGSPQATELLTDAGEGSVTLLAPEHFVGEVANGLRKRVSQNVLSAEDARAGLIAIGQLDIEFYGSIELWFRTLDIALTWQVTAYDALYILTALDLDAQLATADRQLAAAARHHHRPAMFIGS